MSLSDLTVLCTDGSTRKARKGDASKRIAFEDPRTASWVLYEPGQVGAPQTTDDLDRAYRWTTASPEGDS